MDIHSLTLANIGPFVGETMIDFGALSRAGLFLLEGPTGSGKSTVLDAIVFGLYGSVASSAAGLDRMRADMAPLGADSYVDLVFAVNSGIFRVRRSPAYQRPKKSGQGTTTQRASVSVWRLAAPDDQIGTLLSSRSHEADLEIYRAVGLTRSQFIQTVLLPQGEFAAFLRASPTERQTLLQRLFSTELYDAMANELDQRRRDAQAMRGHAQNRLEHATTAFTTAADLQDDARDEIRTASVGDLPNAIDECVAEVKAEFEQAEETHADAQIAAKVARDAVHQAETWNQRLAAVRELTERKAALDSRAPEHRERQATQTLLLAAKGLLPYRRAIIDATARVDELNQQQSSQEQALFEGPHATDAAEWLEDPLGTADALNIAARNLAPVARDAERLSTLQVEHARRSEELAQKQTQTGPLATALSTLPSVIQELQTRIDSTRASVANVELLSERVHAAEARLKSAQIAERLAERIATQRVHAAELKRLAMAAEADLSAVQRARIEGIAAELAADLGTNEPCPVCGSTTHPAPAKPGPSDVSQTWVDEANERLEGALANLRTATDALAVSERELAVAHSSSANATVKDCQAVLDAARDALSAARVQQGELVALLEELQGAEARFARISSEMTALKQEIAALNETVTMQALEIDQINQRVEVARGQHATVGHRIATLDISIATLREIAQTRAALATSESAVADNRKAWERALESSPLKDENAFEQACGRLDELDDLSTQLEHYNAEHRFVTESLAKADYSEIDPLASPIDVSPLAQCLTEKETLLSVATQALGLRKERFESVVRHAKLVREQLAAVGSVIDETEALIHLADIANANSTENLLRIPLPTYVLVTRFKEVLSAANERLATMSDGRYCIEYLEDRESHGRKSGLGISILDRHTEKLRPAGDLSGGETFYTSLALALGLADVVVQEAGGVELGTLFIDEGFGTLDPATLDSVLAEIGRLRTGGRTVGLVSHVDELKQRISERIEVRRSGPGTSSLTVIA